MNKKFALKFFFSLLLISIVSISFVHTAYARSGCCSHHGGVCGCGCCDGSSLSNTCAPYYPECSGTSSSQKIITPVYTPVSTPKPTPRPTLQSTPRPTPIPAKCSDTSDAICPRFCTAGNDVDCCNKKTGYKWFENYGCYKATESACSATADNKCSSMCTAGNDYDCCLQQDGYTWYDNWGCYPKNL